MKRSDLLAGAFVVLVLILFLYPPWREAYLWFYAQFPIITSFLKFAFLASFGELLLSRIYHKSYLIPDFGLWPKFFVWGILGISLYFAFGIFFHGTTHLLFSPERLELFHFRLLRAFSVSFFMNIFYAPVLMLSHHISDLHIGMHQGRFSIRSFRVSQLVALIDWEKMWGFIIKKTIPFFWIPMHTITFMLPEEYRLLIAALLSIVLGLLLAMKKK